MSENNGLYSGYQERAGGKFGKGNPGKPRGATIKINVKVKEAIHDFLENNMEKIQADFDKLKPLQRLQFIAELLPYVTPKLAAIQSENRTEIEQEIKITWTKPDELSAFIDQSNGTHKEGD